MLALRAARAAAAGAAWAAVEVAIRLAGAV